MPKSQGTGKFYTAYESINTENKTAKEAGLSEEEAVAFEEKECSKVLEAALLKTDEDSVYEIIREHINLLSLALSAVHAMYAN